MKIYGNFLCWGPDVEPSVRLLNDFQTRLLGKNLVNADDSPVSDAERQRVYRRTFGAGIEWGVPCWLDMGLEAVMADEKLPKLARVFAARIYKGLPYSHGRDLFEGPPAQDGGGKDGGTKVLGPGKPKRGGPGGGVAIKQPAEARA